MTYSEDFEQHMSHSEPSLSTQPATTATTPASRFEPGSFSAELLRYAEQRFTGKLSVTVTSGERWQLYLHLGNLVWATGGCHPVRRWRRQLRQYCPQIDASRLVLRKADEIESWDYHITWLLALRRLVPAQRVYTILRASMAEVLFDIVRAIASQRRRPTPKRVVHNSVLPPRPGFVLPRSGCCNKRQCSMSSPPSSISVCGGRTGWHGV
ncbi:MAG: hypothetical protein HC910_12610 [Spirulinaceae cyanobacterium SM2_1_0]|nr:hypothetical protein [Spirulinaceae cyanobacterium SM2_1_0]